MDTVGRFRMPASSHSHDPSPHQAWLTEFFAAIDRMDAAAFAEHFESSAGRFRFANQPPLEGRALIEQGCSGIFSLLASIRHEVLSSWVADGDLLVEGQVHYRRTDGFELSVPFMSVFEFVAESPGLIDCYRVFVDSHALFQVTDPQ